ncbi:sigma 54-interacting transcriptional regulator [Thermodesulfobacteriota bacterium]
MNKEYSRLLTSLAFFEGDISIEWILKLTEMKISQVLQAIEDGLNNGLLSKKKPDIISLINDKKRLELQNQLTSEERIRIYQRIAEILIEELEDYDDKALAVAPYLQHLSNDAENCRWLVKAGDLHHKAFRNQEALNCYAKVLKDLSALQGEEIDLLFFETAIRFSKISMFRHNTFEANKLIREALERAKKWNNQSYQALLEMHLAMNELLLSHCSRGKRHFELAWSSSKEIGNPKLLRSAIPIRIFFLVWLGYLSEVIRIYEKYVPNIEKDPKGGFSLLAGQSVGHCYTQIGQVTQGLGMMNAIRLFCLEKGDRYLAAIAGVNLGATLLSMAHTVDAIQYFEVAIDEASREQNNFALVYGKLMLAYAYYSEGNINQSIESLKSFLNLSHQVRIDVLFHPYLMELIWAIEMKKLPKVNGLYLDKEVSRAIKGQNVLIKGVAYRYQAFLNKREGFSNEKILASLYLSSKWLKKSGSKIQLFKTTQEIARQYSEMRNEKKAQAMTLEASKILSIFNDAPVQDDCLNAIKDPAVKDSRFKKILKLGQELVSIRETKNIIQHILSSVNHFTGAERGAIFLLDNFSRPVITGSRNITFKELNHPHFETSIKMIQTVALKGEGCIEEGNLTNHIKSFPYETIRSRICVPMIIRDKVLGVLYHDNRLLRSVFKKSDMELLNYFAAQAAIALDNARAYEEIQKLNKKLNNEKQYFQEVHFKNLHLEGEGIIGNSSAIMDVMAKADQVASTDTPVLILGETGVGKELIAMAIHRISARNKKPFIQANCSSFPESLIQSELFGHEKGAFTGASERRIGRFELADGGTIFLDEIGEVPMEVQVGLLRVLQSKEFERLGGNKTIKSDFRLVAATNVSLEQKIKDQKFREDLFYRISVFPILVPPLRERKEDIPILASYFLKVYSTKIGKSCDRISEKAIEKLIDYDWPGNVRELENIIERSVILSNGHQIELPEFGLSNFGPAHSRADLTLRESEKLYIILALKKSGWKVRGLGGAAELLDIHPNTLASRMKKLGISLPRDTRRSRGMSPIIS